MGRKISLLECLAASCLLLLASAASSSPALDDRVPPENGLKWDYGVACLESESEWCTYAIHMAANPNVDGLFVVTNATHMGVVRSDTGTVLMRSAIQQPRGLSFSVFGTTTESVIVKYTDQYFTVHLVGMSWTKPDVRNWHLTSNETAWVRPLSSYEPVRTDMGRIIEKRTSASSTIVRQVVPVVKKATGEVVQIIETAETAPDGTVEYSVESQYTNFGYYIRYQHADRGGVMGFISQQVEVNNGQTNFTYLIHKMDVLQVPPHIEWSSVIDDDNVHQGEKADIFGMWMTPSGAVAVAFSLELAPNRSVTLYDGNGHMRWALRFSGEVQKVRVGFQQFGPVYVSYKKHNESSGNFSLLAYALEDGSLLWQKPDFLFNTNDLRPLSSGGSGVLVLLSDKLSLLDSDTGDVVYTRPHEMTLTSFFLVSGPHYETVVSGTHIFSLYSCVDSKDARCGWGPSGTSNSGALVGIIIGAVALLVALSIALVVVVKKRSSSSSPRAAPYSNVDYCPMAPEKADKYDSLQEQLLYEDE